MTRSKLAIGVLCVAILGMSAAWAGEVKEGADGGAVWQAGIDGVEIEWGSDSSFNRIYSRFAQPVAFPDRQGISKAQIIAEEKAKAAIIRFLDQQIVTGRAVTEVQNDMNQSTRVKNGDNDTITKTSQRQMVENLSEVTSSFSSGHLRGVIVLERGYDQKEELAWVKVGISRKTMAGADALKNALDRPASANTPSNAAPTAGSNSTRLPGSEVQKSQQKDW
jgi:hypothetical protein